jgi:UDP-GlcNAc:undecaprenyl-phosphate/decaprenyl-phosphate GlcNAc-1-phosphate transferase
MSFPFSMYLLALIAATVASAGSMPVWKRLGPRLGLIDDPGHRKIHQRPIVLAGGLAVASGVAVPLILGLVAWKAGLWSEGTAAWVGGGSGAPWMPRMEAGGWLGFGLSRRMGQLGLLGLGAVLMFALGVLDDRYELRPLPKFAGQVLAALLVAAGGVRITLFVPNLLFSYAITVLWILALVNALNFMDNMNGLCGGIGAIALWFLAWGAAVQGQYLVTMLACLGIGALLGFLPFNFPKASVFLGDGGSHLVGYLLAVFAILPDYYSLETPRAASVLRPLLILAVPLGDLIWVVLLRWRLGQPFYVGDNNHLSHRLVRQGYSKSTAVLLIWLLTAFTGTLGFLL